MGARRPPLSSTFSHCSLYAANRNPRKTVEIGQCHRTLCGGPVTTTEESEDVKRDIKERRHVLGLFYSTTPRLHRLSCAMVSPGVEFLGAIALQVLTKLVPLGCLLHYAARRLEQPLPVWATALITVAMVPVYATLSNWITRRRHRREANAMGARLAPEVHGKWPGGIDIMQKLLWYRLNGYPGDGFREFVAEYGPIINIRILWTNNYFTTWPDHAKRILATDFNNFEKGPRLSRLAKEVLGVSRLFLHDLTLIFDAARRVQLGRRNVEVSSSNDQGESFTNPGALISHHIPSPSSPRNASLISTQLMSMPMLSLPHLKSVLVQDTQSTFRISLAGLPWTPPQRRMLFGQCADSLKGALPYPHNVTVPNEQTAAHELSFAEAFNQSLDAVAVRIPRNVVWPLWELRKAGMTEPMKAVSAFIDPIIAAAVERKRLGDAAGGEKREAQNLLDELLDSTVDPKVLKEETLNILLAGRDTTMHTLTMIIYLLSLHPAASERLRAEILCHIGPTRRPTFEDIKDMKYLRAVINEALRLFPAVPFNFRDAISATTFPSPDPNQKPIYLPPRAQVMYSVLLMQRDKNLWGPDGANTDEFDPDRFIDVRLKKYLLANSFQFLPFNAGPRICLGQQFAYNEMSFMLIRLFQSFKSFHLAEDAFSAEGRPPADWKFAKGRKAIERIRPKLTLTLSTLDGLWVRVTEATSEDTLA
ncbi:Cytochrome P450 [Mycena indigotica]|uniref:Cytochrome P450 n=1 Tax=Mycena indigotica TaxID=2126181 RepID=A0A8H6RY23_9AGAR|nr:Cytochrome P450 [Mycena indigotica]KAF7288982.1 Cytochrome P450 [Mycena indigotica]